MAYPQITLGGIPIAPESGAPEQSVEPLTFSSVVRMSDGDGVKMTHAAAKARGSVSGTGFIPPGLDGLDYSQPLQLALTKPRTMAQPGNVFILNAACRTDREPWARALVDNRWVHTPSVRNGVQVAATLVPGATMYMVQWMPVYQVFADEPPASMNTGHNWSINWEEA